MEMSLLRLSVTWKSVLAFAAAFITVPFLTASGDAASGTTADHLQLVSINAKLTTHLDSKSARHGERFTASIMGYVKTADSMELPKGTVLIGDVARGLGRRTTDRQSSVWSSIRHACITGALSRSRQSCSAPIQAIAGTPTTTRV